MTRWRLVPQLAVAATALALVLGATSAPRAEATPSIQVTTVVTGLSLPWDLTWVERDLMLYDLRAGQVWSKRGSAAPRQVAITGFPSIFAVGESGLLGLVADPASTANRRFYTCQAVRDGSGNALDIRVLRWRMTSDTTAVSDGAPVVTGIPIRSPAATAAAGCGSARRVPVGTGDAAVGTNPQNLSSLGGKVLRVAATARSPPATPSGAAATRGRLQLRPPQRAGSRPAARAPASSGPPSTAATATTRSTSSSAARTTAGTRCRATTSRRR